MDDCAGCCPALKRPGPRVLSLEQIRILYESDRLCIARCESCGRWLVNEGERWEPLLRTEIESD